MGVNMTESTYNLVDFKQYLHSFVDMYKPYLNTDMFDYWVSLKEDSSIILYNDNDHNKYILPNVLPHGVYIKNPEHYCGNDEMIIMDVNQFKKILLKNGFHTYFSVIEEVICMYTSYLSKFNSNETERLKEEVYGIL